MKHSTEQGLTLLEVILAISIFMLGIGFIVKSDAVAHKYFYKGQVRQQMLFYAAGLLEAEIEGHRPEEGDIPESFHKFEAEYNIVENDPILHLQKVQVKVFLKSSSTDPEPVSLFTYRVSAE